MSEKFNTLNELAIEWWQHEGYSLVRNIREKSTNFRQKIIQKGTAEQLVDFDNLVESIESLNTSVANLSSKSVKSNNVLLSNIGFLIVFIPWCFGMYKIFTIF